MNRNHSAYSFFASEMRNNPDLYVDRSSNQVNLTSLAESYLDAHPEILEEDQELVFEAAVDWFDSWSGRIRYNN